MQQRNTYIVDKWAIFQVAFSTQWTVAVVYVFPHKAAHSLYQ